MIVYCNFLCNNNKKKVLHGRFCNSATVSVALHECFRNSGTVRAALHERFRNSGTVRAALLGCFRNSGTVRAALHERFHNSGTVRADKFMYIDKFSSKKIPIQNKSRKFVTVIQHNQPT